MSSKRLCLVPLPVQILNVGVSMNDTDVDAADLGDLASIIEELNREGSEDNLSSSRHTGDKWKLTLDITVSRFPPPFVLPFLLAMNSLLLCQQSIFLTLVFS